MRYNRLDSEYDSEYIDMLRSFTIMGLINEIYYIVDTNNNFEGSDTLRWREACLRCELVQRLVDSGLISMTELKEYKEKNYWVNTRQIGV